MKPLTAAFATSYCTDHLSSLSLCFFTSTLCGLLCGFGYIYYYLSINFVLQLCLPIVFNRMRTRCLHGNWHPQLTFIPLEGRRGKEQGYSPSTVCCMLRPARLSDDGLTHMERTSPALSYSNAFQDNLLVLDLFQAANQCSLESMETRITAPFSVHLFCISQ